MVVILSLTIIIPIFVNVDTLLKRATEAKQLLIDRLYEQDKILGFDNTAKLNPYGEQSK
jgi:hypothetical protein|tara:strand:- start:450 stop:626 length:177 start_codon:yes stop_codon:yes gene_type:complete